MSEIVKSVAQYISVISELTGSKDIDSKYTVVYRGEVKDYGSTACMPNLFRNGALQKNEFFEKNLFEEMCANNLTKANSYLQIAIDAQHGGFQSRLLDVTYNSLVALYFATTPSVKESINEYDCVNGIVYIYFIEQLFCATGKEMIENYDFIVNRKSRWITDRAIFQRNHKLIDHIKMNKRIIAQQGALILFQGDFPSSISERYYRKVYIDGESKEFIRQELKQYFGIYTGSIYPEIQNLIDEITNKSYKITSKKFSIYNEFKLSLYNFNKDLSFYIDSVISIINSININKESELINIIRKAEEIIFVYRLEILEAILDKQVVLQGIKEIRVEDKIKELEEDQFREIIIMYNRTVKTFHENINYRIYDYDIDLEIYEIKIKDERV